MAMFPLTEERLRTLGREAALQVESLVKPELAVGVMAELKQQQPTWSSSRLVLRHHLTVWQAVTLVTVVMARGAESVLGWAIDKRKDTSGASRYSAAELADLARRDPAIGLEMPLMQSRVEVVDLQRAHWVGRFGRSPADGYDVAVNHSTGEIISVLPLATGRVVELQATAGGAADEAAMQAAWRLLETSLEPQVDADTLALTRSIFKFTRMRTTRDEAGRVTTVHRLWRVYSTADVGIDCASGDIVDWYVEALQADAPERKLTAEQASAAARAWSGTLPGARGPTVSFGAIGDDQKATVYWWHVEADCNIEGDHLTVLLNAHSGKVYSVARKWRTIAPPLLAEPALDAAQALQAAS